MLYLHNFTISPESRLFFFLQLSTHSQRLQAVRIQKSLLIILCFTTHTKRLSWHFRIYSWCYLSLKHSKQCSRELVWKWYQVIPCNSIMSVNEIQWYRIKTACWLYIWVFCVFFFFNFSSSFWTIEQKGNSRQSCFYRAYDIHS